MYPKLSDLVGKKLEFNDFQLERTMKQTSFM